MFYDVTQFSSDAIVVGKNYLTIAEMYFRINDNTINHKNIEYGFINWLGDMGGIELLLR